MVREVLARRAAMTVRERCLFEVQVAHDFIEDPVHRKGLEAWLDATTDRLLAVLES